MTRGRYSEGKIWYLDDPEAIVQMKGEAAEMGISLAEYLRRAVRTFRAVNAPGSAVAVAVALDTSEAVAEWIDGEVQRRIKATKEEENNGK